MPTKERWLLGNHHLSYKNRIAAYAPLLFEFEVVVVHNSLSNWLSFVKGRHCIGAGVF